VVRQYSHVKAAADAQKKVSKTSSSEVITYPHAVRKGSVQVTIYRINNPARGEVFEVTWFKEGKRSRKAFRDPAEALKHASETAKALDSGKGESLALGGADDRAFPRAC